VRTVILAFQAEVPRPAGDDGGAWPGDSAHHNHALGGIHTLKLGDGRALVILLDQGFGAWRTETSVQYDFRVDPGVQAWALRSAAFSVAVDRGGEVPLVVEEVQAASLVGSINSDLKLGYRAGRLAVRSSV
jgi:hypothetical protein